MPIIYESWITREMVQANPEDRFVFGDNVAREGYGGQAKAMRGESNAIGVATKWRPARGSDAYFSDYSAAAVATVVNDLAKITAALDEGRNIHVPQDGLGTGLSELPRRAPRIDRLIMDYFAEKAGVCPWDQTGVA